MCWAFACMALFQLRLLSFQASSPELLQPHDDCIVLYYGASKRSSWHSYLPVAKGCSPTVGVSVLPLSCEAEQ